MEWSWSPFSYDYTQEDAEGWADMCGGLLSYKYEDDDYSYDDCSVGFGKLYCENGVLYSGHCGDSCSNDCQVDDITSLYDGKYYCDPSDPSFYFYDEDGDRDPEGTWYLPISDENGCYYNSCEDDDDEDDDDDLDWSCAEDCDNQCLSDKTCLSDCDKPLLERVCDICYVSSAVFFSLFAYRDPLPTANLTV